MIREFSPEQYAAAKRLRGLPPAQYQQALYDYVSRGGSLNDLLAMKAMLDQQDARAKAQEAVGLASQVGNTSSAPQTTVRDDLMRKLNAGVPSLPVDMYNEESYAGGGIVAFQEGGLGADRDIFAYEEPKESQIGRGLRGFLQSINPFQTEREALASAERMRQRQELLRESGARSEALRANITSPWEAVTESERARRGRNIQDILASAPAVAPAEAGLKSLTPVIAGEFGAPPLPKEKRAAPKATAKMPPVAPIEQPSKEEQRQEELRRQIKEERAALEKAAGNRPEVLTPEQAQEEAQKERETALKKAGIKSYKDRIDELAAEAQTLDKNRDTDRWLALAQGFFSMGAGKSRYALQNMAEGLGVTTAQLRDAEKEYRKGVQAQKDRAELLREAERKEVLGDVAAGRELRKDALRAQERFDEVQLRVRSTLLGSTEKQLSESVYREEARKSREQVARDAREAREANAKALEAHRRDVEYGRRVDSYNRAVQAEKAALVKMNPLAMTDPTAADAIEQQAALNVIRRNPAFAELAGISATQPPAPVATQRYNPKTGKLEPVK